MRRKTARRHIVAIKKYNEIMSTQEKYIARIGNCRCDIKSIMYRPLVPA